PQNDVTLKMPAFEWVHVQLHQQKGMISLSPPTICNSAVCGGCVLSVVVELCTIPHKSLTVRSSTPSHKTFFFTHSQLIGCFINNPKGDI
ncbi:hypothetical protein ACNAQA_26900, partial [Klebsiella pneumoniae]|uniref:hypothetical protein n=1 Tax=Klebsiella pneumoniae TaxID=573 RepID=UPI003A4E3CF7